MTDQPSQPQRSAAAPPPTPAKSSPSPAVNSPLPTPVSRPDAGEYARSGPQARWLADQAELTRADPWLNTDTVLTRDADGNLQSRPRTARDAEPAPAESKSPTDGTTTEPPAIEPSDGKIKIGADLEMSERELRDLLTFKAHEDSRKATLPTSPTDYKLELPHNFVAPPGVEFTWATDPISRSGIAAAQEFAVRHGLDQAGFSEMMAIFASTKVAEAAQLGEIARKERDQLGATATQRVTAIQNFLTGVLGSDVAKPFLASLVTARQVSGWEKIMGMVRNQGAGSYSSGHREPDDAPKISDEQWSKMSYGDRKAYAEAHSSNGSGRR
jgi:hypothetical protein